MSVMHGLVGQLYRCPLIFVSVSAMDLACCVDVCHGFFVGEMCGQRTSPPWILYCQIVMRACVSCDCLCSARASCDCQTSLKFVRRRGGWGVMESRVQTSLAILFSVYVQCEFCSCQILV